METKTTPGKQNTPKDTSRESLHEMLLDLAGKDVWDREKARHFFLRQGRAIVPYLLERLETENPILRWELVRLLRDLRDTSTIPGLIASLADPNANIRWLATEGLIHLGSPVVLPLLDALAASAGSTDFRESAYQVFLALYKKQKASRNIIMSPLIKHVTSSGPARGNAR